MALGTNNPHSLPWVRAPYRGVRRCDGISHPLVSGADGSPVLYEVLLGAPVAWGNVETPEFYPDPEKKALPRNRGGLDPVHSSPLLLGYAPRRVGPTKSPPAYTLGASSGALGVPGVNSASGHGSGNSKSSSNSSSSSSSICGSAGGALVHMLMQSSLQALGGRKAIGRGRSRSRSRRKDKTRSDTGQLTPPLFGSSPTKAAKAPATTRQPSAGVPPHPQTKHERLEEESGEKISYAKSKRAASGKPSGVNEDSMGTSLASDGKLGGPKHSPSTFTLASRVPGVESSKVLRHQLKDEEFGDAMTGKLKKIAIPDSPGYRKTLRGGEKNKKVVFPLKKFEAVYIETHRKKGARAEEVTGGAWVTAKVTSVELVAPEPGVSYGEVHFTLGPVLQHKRWGDDEPSTGPLFYPDSEGDEAESSWCRFPSAAQQARMERPDIDPTLLLSPTFTSSSVVDSAGESGRKNRVGETGGISRAQKEGLLTTEALGGLAHALCTLRADGSFTLQHQVAGRSGDKTQLTLRIASIGDDPGGGAGGSSIFLRVADGAAGPRGVRTETLTAANKATSEKVRKAGNGPLTAGRDGTLPHILI